MYSEADCVDKLHLIHTVEDLTLDDETGAEDKSKTSVVDSGFDGRRRIAPISGKKGNPGFAHDVVRASRMKELKAMKLYPDKQCEELAKRVEDVMKLDLENVFTV